MDKNQILVKISAHTNPSLGWKTSLF